MTNEGLTPGVNRNEMQLALSRMSNGKATGLDGIPIDVFEREVLNMHVWYGSIQSVGLLKSL